MRIAETAESRFRCGPAVELELYGPTRALRRHTSSSVNREPHQKEPTRATTPGTVFSGCSWYEVSGGHRRSQGAGGPACIAGPCPFWVLQRWIRRRRHLLRNLRVSHHLDPRQRGTGWILLAALLLRTARATNFSSSVHHDRVHLRRDLYLFSRQGVRGLRQKRHCDDVLRLQYAFLERDGLLRCTGRKSASTPYLVPVCGRAVLCVVPDLRLDHLSPPTRSI